MDVQSARALVLERLGQESRRQTHLGGQSLRGIPQSEEVVRGLQRIGVLEDYLYLPRAGFLLEPRDTDVHLGETGEERLDEFVGAVVPFVSDETLHPEAHGVWDEDMPVPPEKEELCFEGDVGEVS